jgi:DNA polymerase I
VEAAKILIGRGWRLSSGDKVGYIVLAGKGPLYTRVMPYMFAKQDQVDIEYYVSNQMLSAAVRILSYFKVDERELELITKKEKTKSLTDFF